MGIMLVVGYGKMVVAFVVSKLYGVNATIIIFVFVLCILLYLGLHE